MYEAHWGLNNRPFDGVGDGAAYYPAEPHQAALLKLRYAVEQRRECALLTGEAGAGKTLLASTLVDHLDGKFAPLVFIPSTLQAADDLLSYLAERLASSIEWAGDHPPAALAAARLQRDLRHNFEQGHHAVIVIDEVQRFQDEESLEGLRLLLNFADDGEALATFLLVGQTSFLPPLLRSPELEQRIHMQCLLRTLTLEETVSYVNHRLSTAGARREIFDATALDCVHRLSGGAPRRINRLCDLALLVGYAEEFDTIDAAWVESVAAELLPAPSHV